MKKILEISIYAILGIFFSICLFHENVFAQSKSMAPNQILSTYMTPDGVSYPNETPFVQNSYYMVGLSAKRLYSVSTNPGTGSSTPNYSNLKQIDFYYSNTNICSNDDENVTLSFFIQANSMTSPGLMMPFWIGGLNNVKVRDMTNKVTSSCSYHIESNISNGFIAKFTCVLKNANNIFISYPFSNSENYSVSDSSYFGIAKDFEYSCGINTSAITGSIIASSNDIKNNMLNGFNSITGSIVGGKNDIINNQNQNKQEIIDNQNKNTQDQIDNANKNHEEAQETRRGILGTIRSVLDSIISLPIKIANSLIDGLKSLFIPNDMDFINNFIESIETKLGFIAEVPMSIITFGLNLAQASWTEVTSISFPSISIFGYNFWNAQEIDISEGLNVFKPFKYITDILLVVIMSRGLLKLWESFSGGGEK